MKQPNSKPDPGAGPWRFLAVPSAAEGRAPTLAGTNATVYDVQARLLGGETVEDLMDDFPELPREAIESALRYAERFPRPGARPRPPSAGRAPAPLGGP